MKPFDLQAALSGAKVVTRDGREVKIAGYNEDFTEPLIGWLDGNAQGWNKYGHFYHIKEMDEDLFMAPTERKEWVVYNFRPDGRPIIEGPFFTETAAKSALGMHGHIHEITILE